MFEISRMSKKEIWKTVDGYPRYQVSNQGNVRNSSTEHILKPWIAAGYNYVGLRNEHGRRNMIVHRLVADAFVDRASGKTEVNHIDGNKLNNIATNLEWCSHSENTRHAIRTGLFTPYKLPPHAGDRKPVRIIETGETFESLTECAKHIRGFKTAISACLRGKVKTHMGYHFEEVRG